MISKQLGAVAVLCGLVVSTGCGKRRDVDEKVKSDGSTAFVPIDAGTGLLAGRDRTAHSVIELIARPEKYDGAKAQVAGFLVVQKDHDGIGGALYLGREDWELGLFNRVWIRFGACRMSGVEGSPLSIEDAAPYSNGYAVVRGIFEAEPGARSGLTNGTLCGITSITPLKARG